MLISCERCHRQYDVSGLAVGEKVRCHCSHLMEVPKRRAREARMLHCSSCGGKLRADATACEYCGCEVKLGDRGLGDVCPECFARLRAGASYCAACGIRIEPEKLRVLPVDAKCPRCQSGLVQLSSEKLQYTECSGCGGLWLDESTFQSVIDSREKEAPLLAASDPSVARKHVDTREVRYLPCPSCKKLMNRQNFGSCSGVVIDWCKGCGYWFDLDELGKIIEFLRSGGMELARARQAERRRVSEERRSREQAAVRKSLREHGGGPIPTFGTGPRTSTFDLTDILELIGRLLF